MEGGIGIREDGAAIAFRDVSFSYDGKSNALDGLTLDVAPGEFVCVLGGNGSGKSTFARHVDALLLPDSGTVRVLGLLTSEHDNLLGIRSNAGLVFQNPDDQIVAAVVEDDVAFGPENLGVPSLELEAHVQDALGKVGLQGFAKRETTALSGGQKQRVAIAGVYAMGPQIMVFDEASSMLDPRGRKGLMRLCRELNDAGMTIVVITHFMEEAAQADRVVVLDKGCVAMDGAPAIVLEQARKLRELALEAPFAVKMSLALQDAGVQVRTCIDEAELEAELNRLMSGCFGRDLSRLASDFEIRGNDSPMDLSSCRIALRGTSEAIGADAERCERIEAKPIIRLDGVSYSYASRQSLKRYRKELDCASDSTPSKAAWGGDGESPWALEGATFSLNEGEFLGIAGHTGSGKSTLTQLMAGLLHPTEGIVLVRGVDVADKRKMEAVRRSVGMVFQYPEHQLFAQTVFEDVAFGPRNLGLEEEEVDARVRHALEAVHLHPDEIEGKSPFELSGGQQRRVALAGVLAMQPAVLILDEPTAGLDPHAHGMFLNLIAELHETVNSATVMVSHNMDDLAMLCDRIMLLNKGRIVADGAPGLIFSDEQAIQRVGLDVPHTVHLATALGIMGQFEGVPSIGQLAEAIACASEGLEGEAR